MYVYIIYALLSILYTHGIKYSQLLPFLRRTHNLCHVLIILLSYDFSSTMQSIYIDFANQT